MPLAIAIGVHGRFHAFDLATSLHGRAEIRQVATTYPAAVARRFLPSDIPLRTAPMLEALRRLHGRVRIGPPPDALIARRFGRFAARTLPDGIDVYVGWSAASLEAIRASRGRGILTVLERGSTHILHQQEIVARAYAAHGLTFRPTHPDIIARETAEYADADVIAVPTRFAAETFIERGTDPRRILVNPYGVDAAAFARTDGRPGRERPRILFVGGVGIRKGAPDLLKAFRPLRGEAELVFAGPVEQAWSPDDVEGTTFLGPLDRPGIAAAMRDADIFCLPSYEEGLSLALLQAMAAGLPAAVSRESGSGEVVGHGTEGLVVPAGDTEALTDALARLVRHRELRLEMGAAARRRAETLGWDAYGDRALAGYQAALAGRDN